MTLRELSIRPRYYIQGTKEELNLTDDESIVFDCCMKEMSRTQIADKIGCCERKVTMIKKRIEEKLNYIEEDY